MVEEILGKFMKFYRCFEENLRYSSEENAKILRKFRGKCNENFKKIINILARKLLHYEIVDKLKVKSVEILN